MNKKELVEKTLIENLDAWVHRFKMNLIGHNEWEKKHRRAYEKIKEIIHIHIFGASDERQGEQETKT